MMWVDVCGFPGSGKSTICDPIWGPHDIDIDDALPPEAWHDFLNEITRLFHLIEKHPTFPAAIRMVNRSVRKMSTVARRPGRIPYIQTALAQRGLGFGWRIADMGLPMAELEHYFRLMPVSLGVAIARVSVEEAKDRNIKRLDNPRTAHENRSHMVPLMEPAIELALGVLDDRGVAIHSIDVERSPITEARAGLLRFANERLDSTEAPGPGDQVEILSMPPWWVP